MFFCRPSFLVLIALLFCCSAAQVAHCQTSRPSPYIDMGSQRKPEIIDTVVQFRKSAASKAQADAKQKEIARPHDHDSTTLAGEPDSLESKEVTPAIHALPASPAHIKGAAPAGIAKSEPVIESSLFEGAVDEVIGKYAEMIEKDSHEINNYPLYKFIDKWYGTEYRWGGTDNSGIDCSAFSQKLYANVYKTTLARTARLQHKSCDHIKDADDAKEGDLVFFRIHRVRISHVGVYLANGYFVHASRSQGVVISSLNTPYWRRRYASCGKVQHETKAALESEYSVSPTE